MARAQLRIGINGYLYKGSQPVTYNGVHVQRWESDNTRWKINGQEIKDPHWKGKTIADLEKIL